MIYHYLGPTKLRTVVRIVCVQCTRLRWSLRCTPRNDDRLAVRVASFTSRNYDQFRFVEFWESSHYTDHFYIFKYPNIIVIIIVVIAIITVLRSSYALVYFDRKYYYYVGETTRSVVGTRRVFIKIQNAFKEEKKNVV